MNEPVISLTDLYFAVAFCEKKMAEAKAEYIQERAAGATVEHAEQIIKASTPWAVRKRQLEKEIELRIRLITDDE